MQNILRAIALSLTLVLAGCAGGRFSTLQQVVTQGVPNPVSNTRFVSIESSYGVALSGANAYIQNYRNGNRCFVNKPESITNPCSRRSVVVRMQAAIRKSQSALGRARTFLVNNPQLDPGEILDVAEAAVSSLTTIVQTN